MAPRWALALLSSIVDGKLVLTTLLGKEGELLSHLGTLTQVLHGKFCN